MVSPLSTFHLLPAVLRTNRFCVRRRLLNVYRMFQKGMPEGSDTVVSFPRIPGKLPGDVPTPFGPVLIHVGSFQLGDNCSRLFVFSYYSYIFHLETFEFLLLFHCPNNCVIRSSRTYYYLEVFDNSTRFWSCVDSFSTSTWYIDCRISRLHVLREMINSNDLLAVIVQGMQK